MVWRNALCWTDDYSSVPEELIVSGPYLVDFLSSFPLVVDASPSSRRRPSRRRSRPAFPSFRSLFGVHHLFIVIIIIINSNNTGRRVLGRDVPIRHVERARRISFSFSSSSSSSRRSLSLFLSLSFPCVVVVVQKRFFCDEFRSSLFFPIRRHHSRTRGGGGVGGECVSRAASSGRRRRRRRRRRGDTTKKSVFLCGRRRRQRQRRRRPRDDVLERQNTNSDWRLCDYYYSALFSSSRRTTRRRRSTGMEHKKGRLLLLGRRPRGRAEEIQRERDAGLEGILGRSIKAKRKKIGVMGATGNTPARRILRPWRRANRTDIVHVFCTKKRRRRLRLLA